MPVVDVGLLAAPAFSLSIEVDGTMRYAGVNDSLCQLTGLDAVISSGGPHRNASPRRSHRMSRRSIGTA